MPIVDVAVLLAYTAGVVGLGCWLMRRSRTPEEFMAANRRLPGWAVGLSIFGTYVSSISFLALPGKAYDTNWNPFAFSLSLPLAAWIGVRWFVPHYRRLGAISAYDHLEARFGPWARVYAVACYLLTQVVRVGAILFLVALALERLLGWDPKPIILGTGLLVTLYTLLGGIEAVIWTDVVQSIVLGAGALAAALLLLFGMPQGPGQLFAIAAEHGKFSLGSFGASLGEATFWVVLVYGLFMNLNNFGIDQSYVQRYLTARSDAAARRSLWLGALLYVPISAVFFFIGTALFAYYKARPERLPAGIAPEGVFPHFIVHGLPQGFTGLLLAAIFAAAMSSVDSSLNCSATLTLKDIYQRFFRRNATEREAMWVLWISTVAWGVLGTAIALVLAIAAANERTLDVWWKLSGVFSGGMLGIFLLGLLSRRATGAAALLATAVGILLILWMTVSPAWPVFPPRLRSPFHSFLIPAFGSTAIILVGFAATCLAKGERR
ncbi:MAG: sodium/solute symporter [Planctomycetes bacterium]|nr:sodium/solute symporter [Planctomycetota bacterium]